MKTKAKIYVVEGDMVRFDFDHIRDEHRRHVRGRILEVKRRYGRHNNGRDSSEPLLAYVNLDTGEMTHASQHFVVELLERPTDYRPRRRNIFAEYEPGNFTVRPRRGQLMGSIESLVVHYLAALPMHLTMPLNAERARELFTKQRPGLVCSHEYGMVTVNAKPFRAWVRANYSRLLMTVAELDAVETEYNADREREYELDFAVDMASGFDTDEREEPDSVALAAQRD